MSRRALSVLVIVAGVSLAAACGSKSTDPSTVSPDEVAAARAAEESPEIAIVEETIAAANAGDYDEWISHFAPEAIIPLNTLAEVSVEDYFGFETAIGTTRTLAEPCKMIASSVECEITVENDLFAAAGLAPTARSVFFLNNTGRIVTVNEDFASDIGEFWSTYTGWIKDAHPDVYDQIMEADSAPYVLMTPENAPLILGPIQEFVAQSSDYPKP